VEGTISVKPALAPNVVLQGEPQKKRKPLACCTRSADCEGKQSITKKLGEQEQKAGEEKKEAKGRRKIGQWRHEKGGTET